MIGLVGTCITFCNPQSSHILFRQMALSQIPKCYQQITPGREIFSKETKRIMYGPMMPFCKRSMPESPEYFFKIWYLIFYLGKTPCKLQAVGLNVSYPKLISTGTFYCKKTLKETFSYSLLQIKSICTFSNKGFCCLQHLCF